MPVGMLLKSMMRSKRRKFVAVVAVWVGLSLVTALLLFSLDVGDKMNRELRSLGANILLEPISESIPVRFGGHDFGTAPQTEALLEESALGGFKTIFWRNNILGVVPELWTRASIGGREIALVGAWIEHSIPVADGEPFVTGMRDVYGNWLMRGSWPAQPDECVAGRRIAEDLGVNIGDTMDLRIGETMESFRVTGVVASGQREDAAIIAPLETVQRVTNAPGKVSRALVSALTTPENALARKYKLDPALLTPAEYERWVCTPYPGSVAANIEETVPGSAARVVRRVAETQGVVLEQITGLIMLLGGVTLLACVLSVLGMIVVSVVERRMEVALLQAIGATRGQVLFLFTAEATLIGLVGGVLASLTGPLLGQWLLRVVFDSSGGWNVAVMILTPFLGAAVVILASLWPVAHLFRMNAARLLHGG